MTTLGELLRRDVAQVTASRMDWGRWAYASPVAAGSRALREFALAAAGEGEAAPVSLSAPLTELLAKPEEERLGHAVEYVRAKVGRALGIPAAKVDVDRALTDLGLDSLIAVELMTVLKNELGVEFPVVKLLQGITIEGLAALVVEQIAGVEPSRWRRSQAPEPEPEPEPQVAYETLDYQQWNRRQRIARRLIGGASAALGADRGRGRRRTSRAQARSSSPPTTSRWRTARSSSASSTGPGSRSRPTS